jgi:phospholipid/cholesterol/gamma-HCH transport system ATP-binding protein
MIRFVNVTKRLGGKIILNRINFEVSPGETFVIVGLSGAGKSVTLKHMIRLMRPDQGDVLIDGEPINTLRGRALREARSKFGVLFQSAALLQWMTVRENIELPLREHTKMPDDEIYNLVQEKLQLLGLEDAGEKYPSDISGGMQKRVGLARAIIRNPEIVLYDEPTSGLDPVTSRRIDDLITSMRDKLGITSVVVTHDLHSALSIGTRIMMLHEGNIVENATPDDFIHSENETVQQFLASQYITRRGKWEKVGHE